LTTHLRVVGLRLLLEPFELALQQLEVRH